MLRLYQDTNTACLRRLEGGYSFHVPCLELCVRCCKNFDHWANGWINTRAPSHWLNSVARPVGPVLKFRDILALEQQPRTKPVETNLENAYFFLSSRQKLKPPPNECPISPLPLSKVVQDSMAIIHVGFQTKATLNRGWGGGLLFVFRGDGSRAQKLENRWSCLNSFVRG